ncbi:hypothetical protein ACFE04_014556 [Oxalis oulophora]
MGFWLNESWSWKFQWRRSLFQWEGALVDQLMAAVAHVKLHLNSPDIILWDNNPKGSYSTKLGREYLEALDYLALYCMVYIFNQKNDHAFFDIPMPAAAAQQLLGDVVNQPAILLACKGDHPQTHNGKFSSIFLELFLLYWQPLHLNRTAPT